MFRQLARALPKGARVAVVPQRFSGVLATRTFATTSDPTALPTPEERSDYWSIGAQLPALKARNKAAKKEVYPPGYINGSEELVTGPDGNDGTFSHFIRQHGLYPFVGLGAVTLLSKEMVLFDEELLMFGVWGAFVTMAWINLSTPVAEYLDNIIEEEEKQWNEAFETAILTAEVYKEKMSWYNNLLPVLEQQQADYKHMLEVSYKAKNLEARNAVTEATLTQLTRIAQQEALVRDKANSEMVEKIVGAVWAEYAPGQLDAKKKAALLDQAINNIGEVKVAGGKDEPIIASFIKNLPK